MTLKLVSALIFLGGAVLPAQEAWLLEMPVKYGKFLVTKAQAGEGEAVQKILEKLPALIKKGKIKEVEQIKWLAEGGKLAPQRKVKQSVGNREEEWTLGSQYRSTFGRDKTLRTFELVAKPGEQGFSVVTKGSLGKLWCPTFVLTKGDLMKIYLERDETAEVEFITPKHKMTAQWATSGEKAGAIKVEWWSDMETTDTVFMYAETSEHFDKPSKGFVRVGTEIQGSLMKESIGRFSFQFTKALKDAGSFLHLYADMQLNAGNTEASGTMKVTEEVFNKETSNTETEDKGTEGNWKLSISGM